MVVMGDLAGMAMSERTETPPCLIAGTDLHEAVMVAQAEGAASVEMLEKGVTAVP